MKRFKFSLLVIILLTFTGEFTFSQAWLYHADTKKSTEELNLYQLQDIFENYWKGKEIEHEGKGWMQFKRWENFMEPRVYPDGNLGLPSIYDEIEKLNSLKSLQSDWNNLGPANVPPKVYTDRLSGVGRVNCIAFHPVNPDVMWAGAPSGGLWKTTDGGTSWRTTTDELLSIGVSDIAVNPRNPDELYIVTGDGDAGDTYSIGILKSEDGGSSWLPTSLTRELSDREYFRRIIIDPDQPDILLATSNKAIYKTIDGFQSYERVRFGHYKDILFKPGDPSVVYATSFDAQGSAAFYKSVDTGSNFFVVREGMDLNGVVNRIAIAVTPGNPEFVYALASNAANDGFYGFYRSSNSGDTWQEVYNYNNLNLLGWDYDGKDDGGQGWYDLSLAVPPDNESLILTGGINIWKSVNRGTSFNISAHWIGFEDVDYVHADHHMLAYNPLNNNVYSCNDGGIYVSEDDGNSWRNISEGLIILQIYRTSASSSVFDLFLTGNQDNGSMRRSAGEWAEVTGGDGMECIVHPQNPDILYTSYYYGSFFKSDNAGEEFIPVGPEEVEGTGAWVTPFLMSPNDPNVLYAAYNDVFKTEIGGFEWYRLSNNLSPENDLRFLAVAPSNEDYIYTSTFSNIWMTRNGGNEWTNITEGLPNLAITSYEISPNNPEKLWITLSGYSAGEKVYYSEDGGTTWINYSQGLPNVPVTAITYEAGSPEGLYLGTDISLFYRNAGMDSWMPFREGMPNVIISDLEIQYNFNRIIAASYGRGLWASPLYDDSDVLFAEIYAGLPQACIGQEVQFSLNTIDNPDSVVWNFNDEQTISALNNDPVSFSSSLPGTKTIGATVYKDGQSFTAEMNNYFEVVDELDLSISVHDTASLYKSGGVYLYASGAESYSWEPADLVRDPFDATTVVNPVTTTTFTVTGISGNCVATQSVQLVVAPGPVNDSICDATELNFGMNGPFTNEFATAEENEPLPDTSNCNTQITWCNEGGLQHTVWFTYTPGSATASFSTRGFDNQIAIYSANSCEDLKSGNYQLIAANDDYYGSTMDYASAIDQVNLIPGKKYWIQVDGSAGGETGEFYITVDANGLGINPVENGRSALKAYPNPNNGSFTLSIENMPGQLKLELYDISGKLVHSDKFISPGNISRKFDIREKGFYILKVMNSEKSLINQVIVE